MEIAQFWQLIDQTKQGSGIDTDKQAELIIEELASMPLEDMIEFERMMNRLSIRADKYDVYEVASLISGGLGDSSWTDFLAWLIGRGQAIYERVLADPEALVDIVPTEGRWNPEWELWDITAEAIYLAFDHAYEQSTGDFCSFPIRAEDEPLVKGENLWKDCASADEHSRRVKAKFPKAWAKFGWELPE